MWDEIPSTSRDLAFVSGAKSTCSTADSTAGRMACPICGIDLTVANYDTPDADYYCPYCSTPQGPSRISIGLSEDQLEP